jgi:dTDP-4-amino-4,6-dideoxygalactose transaminase
MFRIPFNKPFMVGKELFYIAQSVLDGHISGDGPFTKRCTKLLAEKLGAAHVLLTTSCTSALEMSALLCRTKPGDEVIMPSFTFVSTANAFYLRGAKPRFIDIRPDTLNIDETKIEAAISGKTAAIVPVHYGSVSCEMDTILSIAQKHGIMVVEDAAQGLQSFYKGKALGTIGDLGCLSFHETKNIMCGEGGALIINNNALMERAEILREKGTNRSRFFRGEVDKYTWVDAGSSYLPSDLLASFLYAQLEHMDAITQKRRASWTRYMELLTEPSQQYGFGLPKTSPDQTNGHLFYLLTTSETERDALIAYLKAHDVYAVFHYIPLHLSPVGQSLGYAQGDFPVTESVSGRLVRLPLFHDLTPGDQRYITDQVISFYRSAACKK